MTNQNKFLSGSCNICIRFRVLAMLFLTALSITNANAQGIRSTLLATQSFASSTFPSGWTGSYSCNTCGALYYDANGDGGSNGSVGFDVWDYATQPIAPPSFNASSYANSHDSIWADFDFCWEYSGISDEYPDDHFQMYANNDQLLNLATSSAYTYTNSSDYNYAVDPPTAAADWRHYHILIPVADRTSSLSISWVGDASQGITNPFIDNVTITSYFVPPPELSLTPNPKKLNFGTATPNSPVTLYDTVKSVGAAGTKLGISAIAFAGSSYYAQISGAKVGDSIPVGSYEVIGIQFLPFGSGTQTGTLTVSTTGADSGTQSTSLTGVGAIPTVSFSATSMFRGVTTELTDTSGTQYIYINSTGLGPLSISSVSFIGLDGGKAYFVTHIPAGPIASGSVDSIGVRFDPDIEGLPDAHLVIVSSAANIPRDSVSLYGVGILPHLAIDSAKSYPLPAMVNFDSVNLGSSSTLPVVLWNPGSDTVAIEQNFFESDDPDFSFVPLTGRDTLIAPGGTQTIQIVFTPVQQGTREATIRIRTNIPHTETNPAHDTSQFVINVLGVGNPVGTPIFRYVGSKLNGDSLTVGNQYCVIDTFKNVGTGPLTIDSVRNVVSSAVTYSFPSFPIVIQPDSSLPFSTCIMLSDTGLFNGGCGSVGCSGMIVFMTGNGIFYNGSTSSLNLTTYGIQIGDTAIVSQPFSGACGLDTETILVLNTENVPEAYTASVSGTNANDFTVLTPTTSPVESVGGTATFTVVFNPSTASAETASVIISGGVLLTVPLTARSNGAATIGGQGTAATAVPSAPMESFNDTVTNTGTCPWTPGTPTVPESAPFAYVSGGNTPIPAGGTGLLAFTFTPPPSAGNYSAAVTFSGSTGLTSAPPSNSVYGTVAEAGVQTVSASNGFSLNQNYPNPFNETSIVEITLPVASLVHLAIIDVQGQVVETLLNQHYDAGTFEVTLDATGLASGTYYYQMTAGNVTLTRQMVVLK